MAEIIYYEPKTGTVYTEKPRERNVYRVRNSSEFRKDLKAASTPAQRVAVLERHERSAGSN